MKFITFALSANTITAITLAAFTFITITNFFNNIATLICVLRFRLR